MNTLTCQNCKNQFKVGTKDEEYYKTISVPAPTWCPECRAIRRLTYRNHKKLVKRKCDAPGHSEMIMSVWPVKSSFTVYDNEYWHSDAWDVWGYGRDYDFNKSFFEQFRELMLAVPILAQDRVDIVDSEYTDGGWLKNCYLVFNTGYCEDCAYGLTMTNCRNCFDLDTAAHSELCYLSTDLIKCYRTFYSLRLEECTDAWFSRDCIGCTNIFGCTNLRNKNYYLFNKAVSKEEFEKFIEEQELQSAKYIAETKANIDKIWLGEPVKFVNIARANNATGDYISNSSGVTNSYGIMDAENIADCQLVYFGPTKDSRDLSFVGVNASNLYECSDMGLGLNNNRFSSFVINSFNIEYSFNCWDSNDLFGCVGLRKASYCIFNKQYSREDYLALRAKIIEQMGRVPYVDPNGRVWNYGEFFPIEFSPNEFAYTWAKVLYKLSDEQIRKWGYKIEPQDKLAKYTPTILSSNLPDRLSEVSDSILNGVIGCEHAKNCDQDCLGAFKIIPKELGFYRNMRLPLPRLCFNCRNAELLKWRNPFRLHERKCSKDGCKNSFQTTYEPSNPQIVYCESCYREFVT